MTLSSFLLKIKNNETLSFDETLQIITDNYHYRPTTFFNGLDDNKLINYAGSNEGSCKIMSFAQQHQLTTEQTLNLFGDYYRKDVLENPQGSDHQNIRNFMIFGWEGIQFEQTALTTK